MNGTRGNAVRTARIDVALWVACGVTVRTYAYAAEVRESKIKKKQELRYLFF